MLRRRNMTEVGVTQLALRAMMSAWGWIGWPRLLATWAAQPREVQRLILAPTSRRFATPVASNRGHPHDSPCHLAQNTNHVTPKRVATAIPRTLPTPSRRRPTRPVPRPGGEGGEAVGRATSATQLRSGAGPLLPPLHGPTEETRR